MGLVEKKEGWVYITRVESFNAAHRLFNPLWSKEKNIKFFGKCFSPNYHGHNYELKVCIKGRVNKDTGYIFNAKELGDLMKKNVVDKIDHKNLNEDVDFMKGITTSVENLTLKVWEIMEKKLKNKDLKLYSVLIKETEKIFCEYKGE